MPSRMNIPALLEQNRLIKRGRQIAEELGTLAPDQTRAILMTLLSRVDIRPDRVEINVRRCCLIELLDARNRSIRPRKGRKSDKESEDVLTLTVRARLQRVGREMRMLVENTDDQTTADPGTAKDCRSGSRNPGTSDAEHRSDRACYRQPGTSSANYVYRLLRLPTLAPDIITAIVNGKNPPPQLTAKKLMRLTPQIPVDWAEQRKLLGFQPR